MATKKPNPTALPEGISLTDIKDHWDICNREYYRAFKRARLLDATDRGRIWEAIKATFPAYQILPDTNHVAYVKCNLVASIYTVCKSAQILPTSENDKNIVMELNNWLEHYWDIGRVKDIQRKAGDRAALVNLGLTQVGWDNEIQGGTGNYFFKGTVVLKNVNPLKFMRDPYATSLETAGYCIYWDQYHESVLKANPLYKESFARYLATKPMSLSTTLPADPPTDGPSATLANSLVKTHKVYIHWVRSGDMIHEIHTIDNTFILAVKQDIKPSMFPFAELYCNEPAEDLIGTSEPAKIFCNSFSYNLLNSIMMTAEYKNQRPPKYVSTQSGLNIGTFVKHGSDADYTFVVNGKASDAVHYHNFPTPSANTPVIARGLAMDIQQVTGVDGRYTGRDTGSILTTGGIESMLDQVTMIDAPKVANYEAYTMRLTQLILENMREFSAKRSYLVKIPNKNEYKTITVDFPAIPKEAIFGYALNISSELPKNKARIAQTANTLMEKQMQYQQMGQKVDLFTPEEWLMFQDLPNKEYLFERMGIQRGAEYTEKVSEILMTFAELTKQGVAPDEAIAMTAAQMQAKEQPMMYGDVPEAIPENIQAPEQSGMIQQQMGL